MITSQNPENTFTLESSCCKRHPADKPLRVCSQISCSKTVLCCECLLEGTCKDHEKLKFVDFAKKFESSYASFRNTSFLEVNPFAEVSEILARENDTIQILERHIEEQKGLVENAIQSLVSKFQTSCELLKQKVYEQLSRQIVHQKQSFRNLKELMESFEMPNNVNNMFLNVSNLDEFESKIGMIKKQAELFTRSSRDLEKVATFIKKSVSHAGDIIDEIKTTKPTITNSKLDAFSDSIQKFLLDESITLIQNPIEIFDTNQVLKQSVDLTKTMDSVIVSKSKDIEMIYSWFAPKEIKFNLLYRASKADISRNAMLEKCSTKDNTLCLINMENNNKICGGYSDQNWKGDVSMAQKTSKNTFLFSINNKEKYPVNSQEKAIVVDNNNERPIWFGDINCGDMYLYGQTLGSDGMKNYEAKERTPADIMGQNKSPIKQFELFEVEFI
jgi:hypothetical protein